MMYHGITYADEAYSEETAGKLCVRLWCAIMKNGIITFLPPEQCVHRVVRTMEMKPFGTEHGNFTFLEEEKEVWKYVLDEPAL